MSDENKIHEFFQSLVKAMKLLDERCDIMEKKINNSGGEVSQKIAGPKADTKIFDLKDLGPIAELLSKGNVNDILINGPDSVYIEIDSKLQKTDIKFKSEEEVLHLAQNIAAGIGRYLDPERPYIDARLPDGSRVNIISPPLSLEGTAISIRKFSDIKQNLDGLAALGCMSPDMAEFLKICIRSRINIMVVGGTGTGKTTLLNALLEYLDKDERIVTIEDSAELRIAAPNRVRLETKPLIQGKPEYTEVTITDLLKNALRMRPDRIIVGETRGSEAFDMIQAMNTGHEGSMTTIHGNNGRDALMRLESMISMDYPNMTSFSIKQRIASAIDMIIYLNRLDDGTRKIVNISEITGMESETIVMQTLFEYKEERDKDGKVTGNFKKGGVMPRFSAQTFQYGFKKQMSKIFQENFR